MKPIPLDSLSPAVQQAIAAQAGIPVPSTATNRSRTTAWKDIPSSWATCRIHGAVGVAWYPHSLPCLLCDPSLGPDHTGPQPDGEDLEGSPGAIVKAQDGPPSPSSIPKKRTETALPAPPSANG